MCGLRSKRRTSVYPALSRHIDDTRASFATLLFLENFLSGGKRALPPLFALQSALEIHDKSLASSLALKSAQKVLSGNFVNSQGEKPPDEDLARA